jgi:hypothetical protein
VEGQRSWTIARAVCGHVDSEGNTCGREYQPRTRKQLACDLHQMAVSDRIKQANGVRNRAKAAARKASRACAL